MTEPPAMRIAHPLAKIALIPWCKVSFASDLAQHLEGWRGHVDGKSIGDHTKVAAVVIARVVQGEFRHAHASRREGRGRSGRWPCESFASAGLDLERVRVGCDLATRECSGNF